MVKRPRYKKIIVFLYISKKIFLNKIFITLPFIIAFKIKCLEINPSKDMQDFYIDNYKLLLTLIREDLNKWRGTSWVGRHNIVKISVPPDLIYRFNLFPIKNPTGFFFPWRSWQQNLKFMWKCKWPRKVNKILKNKT